MKNWRKFPKHRNRNLIQNKRYTKYQKNWKRNNLHCITLKSPKVLNKQSILKATREKGKIKWKGWYI